MTNDTKGSELAVNIADGKLFYKDTSNNVQTLADKTWIGTVTNVSALTIGTSGTDLSSTVANPTSTPVITLNVPTASATNRGALSSTDWSTFNNKAPAVTYTTGYIPFGQGTTTPNQSSAFTWSNTDFLNINTGNTGTTIRSTPAAIFKSNGTNTDCNIRFSDSVSFATEIGQQNGGLYITTSGAEQARVTFDGYLRMASGSGGIQFNGDTAAANALDDYEEGTWTPVIAGSTTAGTESGTKNATYTKIGNRVFARLSLSAYTLTGAAGNLSLTGLPFTAKWNGVVTYAEGITPAYTSTIGSGGALTLSTTTSAGSTSVTFRPSVSASWDNYVTASTTWNGGGGSTYIHIELWGTV